MIDAFISGKLIKTPELKTGQSGKFYSRLLLSEEICEDNCRSKATVPTKVFGQGSRLLRFSSSK